MVRFRILSYLACAVIFPASITALSFPAHGLFERQSTCAVSGTIQCGGLPSGFCCPTTSKCLVLASNTTMLCCDNNNVDCNVIKPIVCDLSEQSVIKHPEAAILTTNLTGTLPTCGNLCCPFGYRCDGGTACIINANQGSAPAQTSSPSSTSTPTIVPVPAKSSTSATPPAASATTSTSCVAQPDCNNFPAPAILAGFFPGMFAGAALALACFCLLGAYKHKQERLSGSFGKVSASISDPIYQDGSAIRTDFIRKQNSASSTPVRQPTIQRVRSLFRKSATANGTEMAMTSSPRAPPLPQLRANQPPVTPRLQREPSGESINIFADPSTAREGSRGRDSHQTTFTDMMDRADRARAGEPFGLPPRPSPNSYNTVPRGLNIRRLDH